MIVKKTITEAAYYTPRGGAVWLILSLNGKRYYVFHSQQGRQQILATNADNKMKLHAELHRKFGYDMSALTPEYRVQVYSKMSAIGSQVLGSRSIPTFESQHAEEILIENWRNCFNYFIRSVGTSPSVAEVFLSHCPCQIQNEIHSKGKVINNMYYPASCYEELNFFCNTQTPTIKKWNIYYEHQFHSQSVEFMSGKLNITHRPLYVPLIKNIL